MKCPKCKFNSFEFYDSCPRCLTDLVGYKQSHGLKAMVLPLTARMEMARSLENVAGEESQPVENGAVASDMFSFDFNVTVPETAQETDASGQDDFSFGDRSAEISFQAEGGDAFSFLETTPRKGTAETSFNSEVAYNEFDLKDFSWDDSQSPAGEGESGKSRDDDFVNLFGGAKK